MSIQWDGMGGQLRILSINDFNLFQVNNSTKFSIFLGELLMIEFYLSLKLQIVLTDLVHIPQLQIQVIESRVGYLLNQPNYELKEKEKEQLFLMVLSNEEIINVLDHVEGESAHLQL